MGEEILDRDGEIVIGIHQSRRWRDDAVAVRIRIIGEGDAVFVLQADKPRHGIGARAIHADLAVMIDGHEGKGRIEFGIDDGDVEPIGRVDRLPIGPRRAAKGSTASFSPEPRIASMSTTFFRSST